MMKKWQIIAPLSLAAAGGAAALVLLKKKPATKADKPQAAKGAPAKAAKPAPAKKAPANEKTGSYSFISGFQNASTVEMTLRYDADRFSFDVVEENFLLYSSDSHVALMEGEDFLLQIEYASFYTGEDLAAHTRSLREKYADVAEIAYGANKGLRYYEGDNVCFQFPVDEHSYVLVTVVKAKGNDDELSALPEYEDMKDILGSMKFAKIG